MTPVLSAVYDELQARAACPPFQERVRRWVDDFLHRTGQFPADHPSAVHRLAAAWEDALCRGGFGMEMMSTLEDPAEQELCRLIPSAHRGIFRFTSLGGRSVVHDLWSGAAFVLVTRDSIGREIQGDNLGGLCQARVVGALDGCALLPGVVFHTPEATESVEGVIREARARGLSTDDLCESLLKMDYSMRTLSRVRASYAYRPSMLPGGK